MAGTNISDKTNLTNHQGDYDGANSKYWISQINAGGKIYDIATHHNITFRDGNDGATTVWNGLTDIEVVIPTIKDIVQSPIEFAGTVNKDGEISWNQGFSEAKTGYLVFVTEDCTFKVSSTETTGIACEAGDMAVYDGSKWNVVSGENQVQIVTASGTTSGNKTTIALGEAKDVLTIEGKTLTLALDYKDLNDNHLDVDYGEELYVDFSEATVGSKYIKLEQGQGTNITIANDVNVIEATALKDGKVTFNETTVVKSVELPTLNPGVFPVYSKNSAAISLSVSGGSLTKNDTGDDFVTSVTFGDVTFEEADSGDTDTITTVTNITSVNGSEFLNGIHITGEGETADLTITGHIAPTKGMNTVFVEGLEDESTSVVTSLNAGSFKLVDGSDIATGFGSESDSSGDVISSITVTPNNNASVLNEAKVENHVLSFGTTSVTNSVTVEKKYKSLQKKGFEYKSSTANSSNFVTSGFKSADDVKLTFDKANETTYSFDTKSWKLVTPKLEVNKGTYTINRNGMMAELPAQSVYNTMSISGTLPSLNGGKVSDFILTGSVATDLEIKDKTISAVKDGVTSITIPGAYSLVDGSKGDGVEVGMAGSLDNIEATIDLSSYVTSVSITE